VDFGAQYAQLIARRVREAKIYSEVVPNSASVEEIKAKDPAALILSGGPSSVYADGAPALKPELLELGIPVFGICYGFQAMNHALGGTVSSTGEREYGRTDIDVKGGVLHAGLESTHKVWMSHGDAVSSAPEGFEVTATSAGAPVAAMECPAKQMAGVQYHPEVLHSPHGQEVLTRFLTEIAGLEQNWTADNIAEQLIADVRAQVGEEGRAICALSGGVDSAVAAALVQRAIGDRLTCVFVDHGLLRAGEREQVEKDFVASTGAKLVTADERAAFLDKLAGVSDPEAKRKAIGAEFIVPLSGRLQACLTTPPQAPPSTTSSKARCTRTSSSLAAAMARRILSLTIMSAVCQMMWSSNWSSRCACCLRTRCVPSAASWACRKRSLAVSHSLAQAWVSALSVR